MNQVCLFNSSSIGLCSRRLGFPFITKSSLRGDGLVEVDIEEGLERILRPVERVGELQTIPFLYRPILERERGIPGSADCGSAYDTHYVRENCLDYEAGLGSLFLQKAQSVTRCLDKPSNDWLPAEPWKLRSVYKLGRRWVYKKLELHSAEPRTALPSFEVFHRRLISLYESELGL